MKTVYKLTTKEGKTRPNYYNETQWGENVTHTAPGTGDLCGPGWIHAYSHPLLAVLLNPAHANFNPDMLLWKCKAEVRKNQLDKIGCTSLTTMKQVPLPKITIIQRCAFAILVAKEIYKNENFQKWADNWLSDKDRSYTAADAAAYAAAIGAAPSTPYAAAYAAAIGAAPSTPYAAAYAAYAAVVVAAVAADAVAAAIGVADAAEINLLALAKKAVKEF